MIPPFLIGPLAGAAGVALAGAAFFGWLHLIHDPAVRRAQVAEIAAVVSTQRIADAAAASAALEAQAATTAAQVAALNRTRRSIANAAPSACLVAPDALRAAVLREPRPAGSAAP
ncbi:hypothetical protein [Sandarakinorhabdus sp.]|uniref:hypothetical protein n=1 Tax=Sandarakinorhabdus sp. TaxID=1916663 RepID=UPI003568F416